MRRSHLSLSEMAPNTAPSEEFHRAEKYAVAAWKRMDSKRAKEKGGVLWGIEFAFASLSWIVCFKCIQSSVFSNMQSTIFLVRLFDISILVKNGWVTNRAVQYNYSAGSGCSRTVILYC